MASVIPATYLRTNDVVVSVSGDGSCMVLRDPVVTGTDALAPVIATYEIIASAGHWKPAPRKFVPDFTPYPKLKGSLRNRPCPKCGRKRKRCACSPARPSPSLTPSGDGPPAAAGGEGGRA